LNDNRPITRAVRIRRAVQCCIRRILVT
jgi:hypothetical protein